LGEGRPVVAGLLAAAVFAVGALMQQDVPTGAVAGALGATAYVLAVGMALVRSVPLSDVVLAGLIGLATAALTTLASRTVRGWLVRRGRASAAPEVPSLPGRAASRLMSGMGSALGDWRYNAYVRLALRRVIVLAPLVAVLEARRDPVALYALIVAFSVTQPTASDTVNRALARTAGTIAAILVTFALAALLPDSVVVAVAALAMVAGLAYLLRSPFITTLGTTVLTVTSGVVAGTATNAQNRLLSTVVGAAVGIVATVLIPVPHAPQQQANSGTPSPA
jgi:Fusaric acid resistance protein-like